MEDKQIVDMEKIRKELKKTNKPRYNIEEIDVVLEDAKTLMSMFSQQRWDDRNEWMSIGWCLHNISEGSVSGLELWRYFSSKSDKYQESKTLEYDDCEYEWEKMHFNANGYSIATLRFYAKEDNPTEYSKFVSDKSNSLFDNELSYTGYDYDLAEVFYKEFQDQFVCTPKNDNHVFWYHFKNHRWIRLADDSKLKSCLSRDIYGKYKDKLIHISEEIKNLQTKQRKMTPEDYDEQMNEMIMKQNVLKQICKFLKSENKLANIIKSSRTMFMDPDLLEKMDANKYLIGFKDGVYDFERCFFRPGKPTDYISRTIPHTFPTEYNDSDKEVRDVYDFLSKVFPDKSMREYFLDINCEVFLGGNRRKMIQIWTGVGDNAKSVTQTLVEKSLGKMYSMKLPTSLITGKRTASSNATPEMARLDGVRWAVLQEPDKKDVINQGVLKELSGNDTFFARELFCNGREITPMFKLVIVCNDLLRLPYDDPAIWNRMKVIPFESIFVDKDKLPETEEDQLREKKFLKNPDFSDSIDDMCRPFLSILINRYILNKAKNFKVQEPEKVILATTKYQRDNDVHYKFISECVCDSKDSKHGITLLDFYRKFKDWYTESSNIKSAIPTKDNTEEYLLKQWGKRNEKTLKWEYKIFREYLTDSNDDVENEDELI